MKAAVADTVAADATGTKLWLIQGGVRCELSPAFFLCRILSAEWQDTASFLNRYPQADMKEEPMEVEGRIMTVLPGTMFRVELENKHLVLATICGKMRKRWVRLTVGDRVKMEMSPYDLDKARITWRLQ